MGKKHYKSVASETKTVDSLPKKKKGFHITKIKKRLKTAGYILVFSNVAAYFTGGKIMFFILISIILVTYAIYIFYYPYMYVETRTKKEHETAFQAPLAGSFIAMFSCLITSKTVNFDLVSTVKITFCLAAALAVPYVVKSLKTNVSQTFGRKASVICAVLFISFSITTPLNIILTFDKPIHESVSITDKYVSAGNRTNTYYICGVWHGKNTSFTVSRSVYKETSIGDVKRVCIKKSVFGLEYYMIHK